MAIDAARNNNAAATKQPYLQLSVPLTVDQRQQACMSTNTGVLSMNPSVFVGNKSNQAKKKVATGTSKYILPY